MPQRATASLEDVELPAATERRREGEQRARRVTREAFKQVEKRAFAVMRRVLVLRGRDVTDELAGRSCMVIAPHPDDETLGCGATIARAVRAGQEVRVLIVADGRHSHQSAVITPATLANLRRTEVIEACRILGVPAASVTWLGFEDGQLERHARTVARRVAATVGEFRPQYVLAPSAIDEHADHRALASVVRGLVVEGTISCPVYEYPIWFFHARTWLNCRRPTPWGLARTVWHLVVATFTMRSVTVRTTGVLELKRRALGAFTSQTANLTGEPGWRAALGPGFLSHFLGAHEIFFVPPLGSGGEEGWQPDDL